jgi:hypothetical protein
MPPGLSKKTNTSDSSNKNRVPSQSSGTTGQQGNNSNDDSDD